jgi:hypothetical protein
MQIAVVDYKINQNMRIYHLLQHNNSPLIENVLHPQVHSDCPHPIPQEVIYAKKPVIIRLI